MLSINLSKNPQFMKTLLQFILFGLFFTFSFVAHAQNQPTKQKAISLKRSENDNTQAIDNKLKEDMGRFLGFGMNVIVDPIEKEDTEKKKTKKAGYNLQIGFQLPKFIKTNPPNKLYKIGWSLGVNI
jgi:hypothetical protein